MRCDGGGEVGGEQAVGGRVGGVWKSRRPSMHASCRCGLGGGGETRPRMEGN